MQDCFQEFSWSGAIENYKPIGPGFAIYGNGDNFWGSYYDGKRNNFGRYTFMKTGASYEGNYTNNQKAGFGTMTYPDKSVYTGFFTSTSFLHELLVSRDSKTILDIHNNCSLKVEMCIHFGMSL